MTIAIQIPHYSYNFIENKSSSLNLIEKLENILFFLTHSQEKKGFELFNTLPEDIKNKVFFSLWKICGRIDYLDFGRFAFYGRDPFCPSVSLQEKCRAILYALGHFKLLEIDRDLKFYKQDQALLLFSDLPDSIKEEINQLAKNLYRKPFSDPTLPIERKQAIISNYLKTEVGDQNSSSISKMTAVFNKIASYIEEMNPFAKLGWIFAMASVGLAITVVFAPLFIQTFTIVMVVGTIAFFALSYLYINTQDPSSYKIPSNLFPLNKLHLENHTIPNEVACQKKLERERTDAINQMNQEHKMRDYPYDKSFSISKEVLLNKHPLGHENIKLSKRTVGSCLGSRKKIHYGR